MDPFHGLFLRHVAADGSTRIIRHQATPRSVPDPQTGRPLRVASIEVAAQSVCPTCAQIGAGGFVSFVADLRLAYACPSCHKFVWISGT